MNMASLLDLLSPYPVLEDLASFSGLGDLINLSRANSKYRAALHNFQLPSQKGKGNFCSVRPALLIGQHNTVFWKNLKAKSILCCSEPRHKAGSYKVSPCRICSMPVCEACIIKASFGKRNENTFHSRCRKLCADCWSSGTPHKKQLLNGTSNKEPPSYLESATLRGLCTCSAKDGHLCLECKTEQNAELTMESSRCFGYGCTSTEAEGTSWAGRVCLWCDLPLPRSRAESRREYDAQHLIARSHSSYERPFEEENLDLAEEQRMLELDALSRAKQDAAAAISAVKRPGHAFGDDPLDARRVQELDETLQRRHLAVAAAAEEQRWQRSESLRRHEWANGSSGPNHREDLLLNKGALLAHSCSSCTVPFCMYGSLHEAI